jgi:hypothetical protein
MSAYTGGMKELARKVVQKHLSKTVALECVSCGSTRECAVTIEGVNLPQEWRPSMQPDLLLCSDICEWRWYR